MPERHDRDVLLRPFLAGDVRAVRAEEAVEVILGLDRGPEPERATPPAS